MTRLIEGKRIRLLVRIIELLLEIQNYVHELYLKNIMPRKETGNSLHSLQIRGDKNEWYKLVKPLKCINFVVQANAIVYGIVSRSQILFVVIIFFEIFYFSCLLIIAPCTAD